ncbi:HAMP domain-containing protein [Paenibacillus sp. LMG 31456]|uniref:HAMP domain-containing protein n=2 Tax=Paenibacillus foliorum TaxID=2654974 RepID=A0A972GXM5_9BACL|nr:HAMP domain-containing protein [Paenibacillus foliorum]
MSNLFCILTSGVISMQSLTSVLGNMKLRPKLIFSFALLIVLSALSIGVVSYVILKRSIVNEVGQSIQEVLQQTLQNIDYKLKDIDDLYVKMIMNKELQSIMETKTSELKPNEKSAYINLFYETVYPSIFGGRSEQLLSVSIYGENGMNLTYNTDMHALNRTKDDIQATSIYRQADVAKGKPLWLFAEQDIFNTEAQPPKVISNVRKALALLSFKDWGLVVLNVRESYIFDSYKNNLRNLQAVTFMVDDKGYIISHANKGLISTKADDLLTEKLSQALHGSSLFRVDGMEYSLHFVTSEYTGWRLVTVVPQSAINKNIDLAKNTIVIIVAITIAAALILSVAISSGITRPLLKLLRHIKKVRDGNMDTKVNLGTQEEFGELSESFNEMTVELKNLISKVREDEKRIRTAELRALQSQINPHMLYNTLDSIYWMTITKEYEEIGEMTTALAQFFRLILNKGNELTTISKEVETVEHYLRIQKLQFKDKFDYKIEVDADIQSESCIKLLLQPLVENAILHGIKPLRHQRGFIRIKGRKEGNVVVLEVIDNGIGMDDVQIEALLEQPLHDDGGYGAYNVNERIGLAYGTEYGIQYESDPHRGTTVRVLLPGGQNV